MPNDSQPFFFFKEKKNEITSFHHTEKWRAKSSALHCGPHYCAPCAVDVHFSGCRPVYVLKYVLVNWTQYERSELSDEKLMEISGSVCVSWRPAEWRATPLYVCLSAHRSSAALHCSLTHTHTSYDTLTDVWQPVSQHRHTVMEAHCMLKITPIWSDSTKRNKNA